MSENIPESVPTSQDPRSRRPLKRRALSPTSKQAAHLDSLFANPDREILLPTKKTPTSSLAVPEIVANVQGSSAGAGSGEFHVYKASRRREYERLRAMDEEKVKEEADAEFEALQEERKARDDEKTAKNRAKREKARQRQMKKKEGGAAAAADKDTSQKAKFKPNLAARNGADADAKTTTDGQAEDGSGAPVSSPGEVGIIIHDDD